MTLNSHDIRNFYNLCDAHETLETLSSVTSLNLFGNSYCFYFNLMSERSVKLPETLQLTCVLNGFVRNKWIDLPRVCFENYKNASSPLVKAIKCLKAGVLTSRYFSAWWNPSFYNKIQQTEQQT